MNPPTFEQLTVLINWMDDISMLLIEANSNLFYLGKISLAGFGLMIGTQIWRNFILAKNQRHFW